MKGKLKFIIPIVLLVVIGGAYKFVLAKPAIAKDKINGTVYVLSKEFVLNLADGHFAKLDVALVLSPTQALPAAEGAATPPDGYGALPQEAAVRDVVTNTVTNAVSSQLINRHQREILKKKILQGILKNTDVKATEVLFTDVAVQ